jgi:hypothetical protein
MILEISPDKSYSGIRVLEDLSMCVNLYQQAFWRRCRGNSCWIKYKPSLTFYLLFFLLFYIFFSTDSTPIYQYAKSTSARLKSPESSKPIITPALTEPGFYKNDSGSILLRRRRWKPIFTPMRVWTDLCILAYRWHVWQNLKMEVVSVLLTKRAKQWYSQTVGSMQRD